ncbi:MAG: hypothetical protein ACKVX7_11985 [Planctomycetota bacterium]
MSPNFPASSLGWSAALRSFRWPRSRGHWGRFAIIIICCCPGTFGCVAPYRAAPLSRGDAAHTRPHMKEHQGLVLAASLVRDGLEARTLFGSDLAKLDIVPVVLHLENRGVRTVVMRRAPFRLVLDDGSKLEPLEPSLVVEEVLPNPNRAYWVLPLILPYWTVKERIAEHEFLLREDYRQKSLPDYLRIGEGDVASSRALYFRVPASQRHLLDRTPVLETPVEFEAQLANEGATQSGLRAGGLKPGAEERFSLIPGREP